MPRFDRTGPNGEGSMTGRKNGLCTGNVRDIPSGGFGRGRGRGRIGLGLRFQGGADEDNERQQYPDTIEDLKNEIAAARSHLSELEERLLKIKKQK